MHNTEIIESLANWGTDNRQTKADLNDADVLAQLADFSMLTWWWLLPLALLVGALIVLVMRARRRWLAGIIVAPVVLGCAAASAGLAMNMKYQYFQTVGQLVGVTEYADADPDSLTNPQAGSHPEGAVLTVNIPGTVSGVGDHPAMVYLPPQYFDNPTQHFPVVYLYHGVPDLQAQAAMVADGQLPRDYFMIFEAQKPALAAAKAGTPVVLVAPTVSKADNGSDLVDGTAGNWQTYVSTDVTNWVTKNPRLTGSKSAAAGFSMGGYGALITALRNPAQFAIAGNLSGSTKPTGFPYRSAEQLFHGDAAAGIRDYTAGEVLARDSAARSVQVWQTVGQQDCPTLHAAHDEFARTASGYGMTVQDHRPAGGHDFGVWKQAMDQFIPWAATQLHAGPTA